MIYQLASASEHQRLRNAINIWRAWHLWWKSRRRDFLQRMARRALASAVCRWRLEASASRSRRQGAVKLLGSLRLRRCLVALAQNAYTARILRRVLESYRMRILRDGLLAWGSCLVSQDNQNNTEVAVENPTRCVTTRRHRRNPGKPRKVHCRCVYAVSRGQRCTCAPRSHLLRRVEELHRLVVKGLDGRDGGHRLLSHVVQRPAAPRDFREGSSSGRILSQPPVSEGLGTATSRARLAGSGKVCGPSRTRCCSDESSPTGTSKPVSSLTMEDTDSYLPTVAQHTAVFVERQIDELAGIVVSPAVAGGPRCV